MSENLVEHASGEFFVISHPAVARRRTYHRRTLHSFVVHVGEKRAKREEQVVTLVFMFQSAKGGRKEVHVSRSGFPFAESAADGSRILSSRESKNRISSDRELVRFALPTMNTL